MEKTDVKFRQAKVTPGIFDAVKILLQSNENISEVAKFMKMSWDTVKTIREAGSYEEYKNLMYLKSSAYRKKMAAIKAKEEKKQKAEEVAKEVGAVPAAKMIPEEPPKQIVEYRQNVTVQATHYMMEELKKIVELLTVLNNKIGFIVDELTK